MIIANLTMTYAYDQISVKSFDFLSCLYTGSLQMHVICVCLLIAIDYLLIKSIVQRVIAEKLLLYLGCK